MTWRRVFTSAAALCLALWAAPSPAAETAWPSPPDPATLSAGPWKDLVLYGKRLVTETVLGIPTTAHILGGVPMGASSETGAIDHRHRLFGYDGLYVIDGSAISANPGVNPSLTIAALAERAMGFIPPKGQA